MPELKKGASINYRFLPQDADKKIDDLLSLIKEISTPQWFFNPAMQSTFIEFLLALIENENGEEADLLLTALLPAEKREGFTKVIVNIAQEISGKHALSRAEALVIMRDHVLTVKEGDQAGYFAVDMAKQIADDREKAFTQEEALAIICNRKSEIKKAQLKAFVVDFMPRFLDKLPTFLNGVRKCWWQQNELDLVIDFATTLYEPELE